MYRWKCSVQAQLLDPNKATVRKPEDLFFDLDLLSSIESDADMSNMSMKGALREAINELAYRDKTMLIMRYYFKCSGREIAEFLAMPENQVASYMKHAKERLRALLDYPQAA